MKKLKNKLFFLLLSSTLWATAFCPVMAKTPYTQSSSQNNITLSEITPRADDIGWQYKTINGKLYRRLYNYTKNVWISDWELVG